MEKYYFIEDILFYHFFIEDMQIFCSNLDEEYKDKKYLNLVLELLKNKKKDRLRSWKFFKLAARNFHLTKHKTFFQSGFFIFFELRNFHSEICLALGLQSFIFQNKTWGLKVPLGAWRLQNKFFFKLGAWRFHFSKYKKVFNVRARKFPSVIFWFSG